MVGSNRVKKNSTKVTNKTAITKQAIMLSLVEVLYNSNSINDATYTAVRKAISREVKS